MIEGEVYSCYIYLHTYVICSLTFFLNYYTLAKIHNPQTGNSVQNPERGSPCVTSHNVMFRAIFLFGYPGTVSSLV